MKVLGIVPARAGSKRLPRKNLLVLGGRPLVARAIEACTGAKTLARVVVTSDSEEVLAIARAVPGVTAIRRPDELATDTSPAVDYVKHALSVVEGEGDPGYDAVAIVQPTSPFTLPADIDATVALLESAPEADSAVSVVELDHAIHPVKLKRLEGDRLLPYLEEERARMAAHELPKLFVRNCSVYAVRRSTIDRGEIIGNDSRAFVMPRNRSLDINDELDFELAVLLETRARGGSR